MSQLGQPLIAEMKQEAGATRRVLERVPADRLAWRPHPKSMSLGQLALHVARIPGALANLAKGDGVDASTVNFEAPAPASADELVPTLESSVASACEYLETLDAEAAGAPWRLTAGGREIFNIPRAAMLRTLMLNHWYHHRGQLVVYLRLLDVPVPSVYGPSADENPFAAAMAPTTATA
ncbi:MAG: DinB family protein [Candidatus Eiseniibacteriota bacterium]